MECVIGLDAAGFGQLGQDAVIGLTDGFHDIVPTVGVGDDDFGGGAAAEIDQEGLLLAGQFDLQRAEVGEVQAVVIIGSGREGDGDFTEGIGLHAEDGSCLVQVFGCVEGGFRDGCAGHSVKGFADIAAGGHTRGIEREIIGHGSIESGDHENGIYVGQPLELLGISEERITGCGYRVDGGEEGAGLIHTAEPGDHLNGQIGF